jgi:ABC-type uncharacterized transport system permease subunit
MNLKIERNPAPVWFRPLIPLLAIVLTMVITSTLVLLVNANPLQAYYYFLVEPLSSRVSLIEVLVKSTPLLLTGAAPISPELIRWYLSLGVPMVEGDLFGGVALGLAVSR